MHCKNLELEKIPPKQKLRMLQITARDVANMSNVKQLSDKGFCKRRDTYWF
jgi:hypothetical protein